jgi:hypothetical protein
VRWASGMSLIFPPPFPGIFLHHKWESGAVSGFLASSQASAFPLSSKISSSSERKEAGFRDGT